MNNPPLLERYMIEIYHVPGTRGVRPIWLCAELGVDYRVIDVDFSASYRSSPEWRRMNPVGKVPVMVDTDADGLMFFESGAMVQYLLDRFDQGSLEPERGSPDHALYLQWSWFAEATFARPLGEIVNHLREFPDEQKSEAAIEEMRNRARLCLHALTPQLKQRDYIVGDSFSAADIMLGYSVMLATKYLPEPLPNEVADYWNRLSERPAYKLAFTTAT
jgi:glutathione S-transferase